MNWRRLRNSSQTNRTNISNGNAGASSSTAPQYDLSRHPSIASVDTFGRRPPSYATQAPVNDDQRTISSRWSEQDDTQDTFSLRPPSYHTVGLSVDDDDFNSENQPSDDLHTSRQPFQYAPNRAVLENQFANTSISTSTDEDLERAPTPTLRPLRPTDLTYANPDPNTLYELSWSNDDLIDTTPTRTDPPEYSTPRSFSICSSVTEALVTTHHLSGHLTLLHAFWRLRKKVEEMDSPEEQPVRPFPEEKDRRWAWLVSFAVERFSMWCESLNEQDVQYSTQEIIPPLDVLMVWHTYLLNPAWYAEDCKRIPCLRVLSHIGQLRLFPALTGELGIIIDSPLMELRREVWSAKTEGRPFDIFEDARQTRVKKFKCPDCMQIIEHPYMDSKGTGYLQNNFEAFCANIECYFVENPIDKTSLGARKLAQDIVRSDDSMRSYIAGTLWSPKHAINKPSAARIKTAIVNHERLACPKALKEEEFILLILKRYVRAEVLRTEQLLQPDVFGKEGWTVSILKKHRFTLVQIVNSIADSLKREDSLRITQRIWTAYMDGNIFSVDLVGAVLRQSSFVEKMHEIGWSRPAYFAHADNEEVLQYVVARYHAFLDLVAASSRSYFVPTLDIDLAWHTHQLFGVKYHDQCKRYVRFYLDHDDKVEEGRLSNAFDDTCRAWWSRFKVQYSYCGCPLPGKQIFGSDIVQSDAYKKCDHLLKPRSADDIVFQAATHASDHNAVYDDRRRSNSEAHRRVRLEKRSKRENRDDGLLKGLTKGKSEKLDSTVLHDPAFFSSIPDWYFQSTQRADCVLYAAHTIDRQYSDSRKYSYSTLQYSDLLHVATPDGLLRHNV